MARKCLFIQALDGGSGEEVRLFNSAILGGTSFEPVTPGVGAIARGHGVLTGNSLKCTATSPTPDNQVQIAAGFASIRGTQAPAQGTYVAPQEGATAVTIAAKHATLTRIDYVVAQVRDDGYAAFVNDDWILTTVQGTPGSGVPAVPHDCLVLAMVTVLPGVGSTVINPLDILDLRPQARATGAITPVASRNDVASPQENEFIWEYSTQLILKRQGSTWVAVSANISRDWDTYAVGGSGWALGASGTTYGRYVKLGRTVTGIAGFTLGGTGNVHGPVAISLPVPAYNAGANIRFMCAGRAFIGGLFYGATAEINPSFNPSLIFNFATAGTTGWNASIPAGWGSTGQLRVFFNYEAA